MSTPVTSPETPPAKADSLTAQWADFFDFVRRPRLPQAATGPGAKPLIATLRILALDILLTIGVLIFFFVLTVLGIEPPDNIMDDLEFTPAIIALIVLGAPIGEELIFRSWLSGRPGHVLAPIALVSGALGIPFVAGYAGVTVTSSSPVVLALAGLGLGLTVALLILWLLRKRGPWGWFARIFPIMLLLSALSFAFVHVFNYQGDPTPLVYVFVLPQFVLGLVAAYARVNFGLWSCMLLHALHNGTAVLLIMAFADVT